MSELALAALLAITILIASTVSVEIGISVALIELAAGVVVGNVFTVTVPTGCRLSARSPASSALLTALAVEGPLPAYAATVGEVEEVRREKDSFFDAVAVSAREQAETAGVELEVEVRPGHAAELITRHARDIDADLVVVGHKGHFLNDDLLGSTADRVAHHAHYPVMIVK